MNQSARVAVFWIVLFAVGALLWAVVRNQPAPLKATYSQFLQQVQSGEVLEATIRSVHSGGNPVDYSLKNGARFQSVLPHDYRDALNAMQQKLVNVEINPGPQWSRYLANSMPFLILLAFWFFALGQMKQRGA